MSRLAHTVRFLELRGQKQNDEGQSNTLRSRMFRVLTSVSRALALKALDQRIANSSSPVGSHPPASPLPAASSSVSHEIPDRQKSSDMDASEKTQAAENR